MIWRHLSGYMASRLVGGLASFGAVFAYTRLLSPEQYGQYALILAGIGLMQTLTITWSEAAAYRFSGPSGDDAQPDHIRTTLGLLLTSSVVAIVLLVCGLPFVKDTGVRLAMVAAGAGLLFAPLVNAAQEMNRAQHRVGRYAFFRIAQDIGAFALGVFLAWRTGLGAAAPFAGLGAMLVVLAVVEGSRLIRESAGGQFKRSEVRRYAGYGLPVAAALALHLALDAGDRFLIAHYLGQASVGVYAAGYGVADKTVGLLCGGVAAASAPLMMRAWEQGGVDALRPVSRQAATTLILFGAPAALGIALVAEPLGSIMIGDALRERAVTIIPWIAFSGLLSGFAMYYVSEAFQLSRRTHTRAFLMIAPVIANLALNAILLPRIGLMGAVYATVGCYTLALILLGLVGRSHAPLSWPMGQFARIAIACVGMAVAVKFLPAPGGFSELLLKSSVGGVVYAVLVLAFDVDGLRKTVVGRLKRNSRKGLKPSPSSR